MSGTSRADIAAIGGLTALALSVLALHAVPHRGIDFGRTLVATGCATAAWIVVVRRILAGRFAPALPTALALTVGLRLITLPLEPQLSDDVFRYVHEGRAVLAGTNPYLVAPADEATVAFRGPEWSHVNNPSIPAAYPPAVQLATALGVAAFPSPTGVKLVFGLIDVLTFLLLWGLCRSLGFAPQRALVHGLCPLVALEFAGEGHGDSLAACAMVGAAWAARAGKDAASGLALAIGTAAKWLPGVLLPFVARRTGLHAWFGFVAAFALLWAPFVTFDDPARVLTGTAEYAARWRHNDTLYGVVHALTAWLGEHGWLGDHEVQRVAKWPIAALGLACLAFLWRVRASPESAAFWFFAFFLACAPTVHPWYVAGLFVPWLALRPDPWLLAFCGTILIADHPVRAWRLDGVWNEDPWAKAVTWLPFYVGIAREGIAARARQRLIQRM